MRIGGVSGNATWSLTQSRAIHEIERSELEFYVRNGGSVIKIVVATSRQGSKYLKAENDGEQPNTLLALPDCPFDDTSY